MIRISVILPLLLATGCQPSTPLAGGSPVPGAPSAGSPAPAAKNEFSELTGVTFKVTGGFAGITDTLTIGEGHITLVKSRPAATTDAVFTKEDTKQLAAVLHDADFAHLVGDYHQKNLADGFGETVTIVVGTGTAQKTYTVTNYGDQAPAGYYKVTAYLRGLQNKLLSPIK